MANYRILFVIAFVLALCSTSFGKSYSPSKNILPISNRIKKSVEEKQVYHPTEYPPILNADLYYVMTENDPEECFDVLANDVDLNGNLQVNASTLKLGEFPHNGDFRIFNGTICYKPFQHFSGFEGFSYTIEWNGEYEWAAVRIYVAPVITPPTAVPDVAYVNDTDYFTIIDVLHNDYDVDGYFFNYRSLKIVEKPQHGKAWVLSGTKEIYYEPYFNEHERFYGEDTFIYQICDDVKRRSCSHATVTIHVEDKCIACEKCANNLGTYADHTKWLAGYYQTDVIDHIKTLSQ